MKPMTDVDFEKAYFWPTFFHLNTIWNGGLTKSRTLVNKPGIYSIRYRESWVSLLEPQRLEGRAGTHIS